MSKKPFVILPVFLLFLFSLFIGIDRFTHRKSTHFSLSKISAVHEISDSWEVPPLSIEDKIELDKILNQSFTFFGKSTHAYLFISEDHKYIIKFLKQHALRPKSWLAYIPLSFNPYYEEYCQKLKFQKKIFSGYKQAFTELKEKTGLIYVHINRTCDLNKKISIYDKNEKPYIVDLDKTSFYIQKRAQLLYFRISELMRAGDIPCAKNIISSVFLLIDYLNSKGIRGDDLAFYKNFGIIDNKAVQLAISKIQIHPNEFPNPFNKISEAVKPFRAWIKKNYSELLPHFDEKLKELEVRG